jgi:hypothetical protein
MAGNDRAAANAVRSKSFSFNPIWGVDALGVLGLCAFGWGLYALNAPEFSVFDGPVREAGLVLFGAAVVVRALDVLVRRRDRRGQARRELLRRLSALDEAVKDLRVSLSRDAARRFIDRRNDVVAAVPAAARWLGKEEARLVAVCQTFCDDLAGWLSGVVAARIAISTLGDRLRREIDRAAAHSDLDPDEAESLTAFVGDAVAVIDEAVYAEWNIDHLGRLSADRRHFERVVQRWSAPSIIEIERHGEILFDGLAEHVGRKVEVVDRIVAWDRSFRRLEARLGGLKRAEIVPLPLAEPRLADRFLASAVAGGAPYLEEIQPVVRLPAAAND